MCAEGVNTVCLFLVECDGEQVGSGLGPGGSQFLYERALGQLSGSTFT